jgi:branched-chain amino acid transport system ATP-binding protein
MSMLLEVKNITVHYGKSLALKDASLQVPEGAIVSIIGANGAGKSTLLKGITGLVQPTSGEIIFNDNKMTGKQTSDIVKMGVTMVPEGRKLFPYLSVLSNLRLGASARKDKTGISRDLDMVFSLFPRLKERTNQNAGTLSGGEQQMLAIARSLMANPRLLCMDEPSLGLAPVVVDLVGEVIKDIQKKGVSVLLAEQNIHLALGVANYVYALHVGRIVLEGDVQMVKNSDIIKKAYLGE